MNIGNEEMNLAVNYFIGLLVLITGSGAIFLSITKGVD